MHRIEWTTEVGRFTAIEPTPAEVEQHAAALAEAYNHPANAALMGHTAPISPEEVAAHYAELAEAGARPFLLLRDGALMGDGDLRGFHDAAAEFAFMIAAPSAQGQGLGTRYALMIAAFGFRACGLARIYASVVPHNTASRRVFEKLGYTLDATEPARRFAEEPDDVVYAIDRATFEARHAAALAQLTISPR